MMPAMLWAFRSRVPAHAQVDGADGEAPSRRAALVSDAHRQRPVGPGRGFRPGADALAPGPLRRRRTRRPIWRTSNPRTSPYYLRFGFEVTGEIKLPDGGPEHVADVAGAALAPGVLGAQPCRDHLERLALQDRALAPNALFGHVEHPVQPHPALPGSRSPSCRCRCRPSRSSRWWSWLDSINPSRVRRSRPTTSTGRSLPRGRVVLVDHPGPHDLAGIGAAVEIGRVHELAGPLRGGTKFWLTGRPAVMAGPRHWRGAGDRVQAELDALLDAARHGVGLLAVADELRRLVEHQVLRDI